MKTNTKKQRSIIAIANMCAGFLLMRGFLTDAERQKVHERILKYRDKHSVHISDEQLMSVELTYDDDAKE